MKLLNKILSKRLNEIETLKIVLEKIKFQIYSGPFSGLKIPEQISLKLNLYEILGIYESCIRKPIEKIINSSVKNVMIVGGNRGYYSAGFSYLLDLENMYVFEMDNSFHKDILSWGKINKLNSNITILDEANESNFLSWEKPIDFILMDCEGAENTLLNPQKYTWQKNAIIIVEIHHFYNNAISGNLIKNLKETHEIEMYYDNYDENLFIDNFLDTLKIKGFYPKHPWHRWIKSEKGNRIFTNGVFLFLVPKK